MTIHLILGGARSGKSSFAEKQAQHHEQHAQSQVYYLATAQALDEEMSARIKQHQQQRSARWPLIESPIKLSQAIEQRVLKHQSEHKAPVTVLVDCLTLWLTNCLCSPIKNCWQQEKQSLLKLLASYAQSGTVNLLLVSNEVGHGIVPMGELSRNFVDQAGWLHQDLAAIATQVDFIIAGIALSLKSTPLKSKEPK